MGVEHGALSRLGRQGRDLAASPHAFITAAFLRLSTPQRWRETHTRALLSHTSREAYVALKSLGWSALGSQTAQELHFKKKKKNLYFKICIYIFFSSEVGLYI